MTTWRGGEGHRSGSEGCPPSPPFRTEAVFLDGGEPGQGGAFAGRFFRSWTTGKSRAGGPQGVPQSSSRMRPLKRLAACRDNGASGEGVRALSAGAITVLPTMPAIPEGVSHLVRHLWAEAWKAADSNHEPDRQAFQRERAEHEQLRAEKDQEIARLEAELSRVEAERESTRAALTKAGEELERERVERAKAESAACTLNAELTELRIESRRATETVAVWVERASRAEARLEELAKGVGGHRS